MPTEKVNVRPAESPRQGHALADTTRTHGWIPVPAEFSHPDASTFVAAPAWPMVALSMGAQQKEQVARPGEEHHQQAAKEDPRTPCALSNSNRCHSRLRR
mgnify:CR=1 FL=1